MSTWVNTDMTKNRMSLRLRPIDETALAIIKMRLNIASESDAVRYALAQAAEKLAPEMMAQAMHKAS
jgi:hypothetical protein